jgi:hypothetical protein
MDFNFPVFATGVRIFRASNDVGPLFMGPGSTRILEINHKVSNKMAGYVSAFHPFIFQKSGKSTIIRNLAVPRHFVTYLVVYF